MFELDATLPAGALIGGPPDPNSTLARQTIWWHGAETAQPVDPASGAIRHWAPLGHGPNAVPTKPSQGQCLLGEVDNMIGLQTRTGTHGGLVAADALPEAHMALLAVRYYAPNGSEPRTLLTLNTGDGQYLFLSEADQELTAKDNVGRVSVSLPVRQGEAPRLAIVTLDGPDLTLTNGVFTDQASAAAPVLEGPASLFIGCRNHRPGLKKTLGAALILDVWLGTDAAPIPEIRRHHLWADL